MLIDGFVPKSDVFERHESMVRADAATAYRVIRTLDFARSPVVRGLFLLRGIPAMLRRGQRRNGEIPYTTPHLGLEDVLGFGFVVLAEEPGVEIVLGAVGRFWRPRGDIIRIQPEEFESFDRPGFAKGAMNIRVEPAGDGLTRIVTETRVRCTDARSRRSFLRYWRVIGPFSALIRRRMLAMARAAVERPDHGVQERGG
jgi:hypothetical protein